MTTAVVFDYGFGNVRSMVRALANLGVDTTLTSDYRQSLEADGLVVPGVGAFAACMEGLKKVDGDRVIYDRIRAGRPVLGVCVGLFVFVALWGLNHFGPSVGEQLGLSVREYTKQELQKATEYYAAQVNRLAGLVGIAEIKTGKNILQKPLCRRHRGFCARRAHKNNVKI